ncbi:hypothetical protein NUACC21_80110 [Scytonema sp. NUACC21]
MEAQSKLEAVEHSKTEPIAIIGMGCRFPGGVQNPEMFWQLLRDGMDAVTEIPSERWNIDAYYDPKPESLGKIYTKFGSFLQQVDQFDPQFFGISPREAKSIDPQQRLLLQVSWEALENAGVAPERLSGSNTGIFVGVGQNDYAQLQLNCGDPTRINAYDGTGNAFCFASGRLSYTLGLQGPSMTIDTACSSSLVAVHLACESLRRKECDMALAGGVHLVLSPEATIFLCQTHALSPDGRCKTFDATADGYGRGEGCGVLVLKRLSDAVAQEDNILALIRGSAVNHDGSSNGLTVPNGLAQQALLRQALKRAKEIPARINYLETHGTGTSLGDPIEVRALAAVFGEGRSPQEPLVIGSVKTNIGHLEAAAGVASLIKVVLALQNQEIPPHLHFKKPNPHINWHELPVVVPTKRMAWVSNGRQRLAGVSSFGMSGTNAHAVLEEAPVPQPRQGQVERPLHLLTLSAKTEEALQQLAIRYKNYLADNPSLALGDICCTTNIGRSHFQYRLSIVASSTAELSEQLVAFTSGQEALFQTGQVQEITQPKIGFLFPGKGSQSLKMGHQLYETQPTFRAALNHCNEILQSYLKQSLLELLYPQSHNTGLLDEIAYTEPLLFAVEYALAQLWQSWGIKPAVVMGHDLGEYVAACVAGVFSLEDGLRLICTRAGLMQPKTQNGRAWEQISQEVTYSSPQISIISTVTGELVTTEMQNPKYWYYRSQEPVNLVASMKTLQQEDYELFVECGPNPVLSEMGRNCFPEGVGTWLPSLRADQSDWQVILQTLGILYNRGVPIDWWGFHRDYSHRRLQLPTYPFAKQRYWVDKTKQEQQKTPSLSQEQIPTPIVQLLHQGDSKKLSELLQQIGNFAEEKIKLIPEILEVLVQQHQQQMRGEFIKDWCYQLEWELKPRLANTARERILSQQQGLYLILADFSGVGQALAELLKLLGYTCVLVYPGEAYQSLATQGTWYLNPAHLEDFERLFKEIWKTYQLSILKIVHLWSLEAAPLNKLALSTLKQAQILGCGSVLHLVQTLVKQDKIALPRLWLVTRGAMAVSSALPAVGQVSLWGFGKSLSLEYPDLWGGILDLAPKPVLDEARTLLAEIEDSQGEDYLAFDSGKRHVARLVKTQVSEPQKLLLLKPNATYLITGGLGSLGLKIAEWMVRKGARYLVLVGRSQASTQAQETIRAFEETGAKILVAQADVSNETDMVKLLEHVKLTMPPVQGIIHGAGVLGFQTIEDMNLDALLAVLSPKVFGTWNLHVLSQSLKLDFFVSFSSIAAVWGSKGQAHYAAANHFLDGLTHYRQGLGLPTLSINWGPWADAGMAASLEAQQWLTQVGIKALEPEQALTALEFLLQGNYSQMTTANVDWALFKRLYEVRGPRPLLEKIKVLPQIVTTQQKQQSAILQRLEVATESERQDLLISYLQTEVAKVMELELSQLPEPQQGFFDMGMDSLMAVQLKEELEASIGCSLPTTLILECPNIRELARYLGQKLLPKGVSLASTVTSKQAHSVKPQPTGTVTSLQADEDGELSTHLQTLSEEEIADLLAQKLACLD